MDILDKRDYRKYRKYQACIPTYHISVEQSHHKSVGTSTINDERFVMGLLKRNKVFKLYMKVSFTDNAGGLNLQFSRIIGVLPCHPL